AVAAHHRLDHQRRDVLRALEGDHLLEVVERALRLDHRVVGEERAAVGVGREEVHDARQAWLVRPAAVLAGERAGARRRAVERAVGGQHLVAPGEHASHLDGVLVRLAAAGGEEGAGALAPGAHLGEQRGELAAHVVDQGRGEVAQLGDLFLDGLDHARVTVPEVGGHQAGGQVEVALAGLVEEERALAAHDGGAAHGGLLAPRRQDVLVGAGGGCQGHLLPPQGTAPTARGLRPTSRLMSRAYRNGAPRGRARRAAAGPSRSEGPSVIAPARARIYAPAVVSRKARDGRPGAGLARGERLWFAAGPEPY